MEIPLESENNETLKAAAQPVFQMMSADRIEWQPSERKQEREAKKYRRRLSYLGVSSTRAFNVLSEIETWLSNPEPGETRVKRGGLTQHDAELVVKCITKWGSWRDQPLSIQRAHHKRCRGEGKCKGKCTYAVVAERNWKAK